MKRIDTAKYSRTDYLFEGKPIPGRIPRHAGPSEPYPLYRRAKSQSFESWVRMNRPRPFRMLLVEAFLRVVLIAFNVWRAPSRLWQRIDTERSLKELKSDLQNARLAQLDLVPPHRREAYLARFAQ